MIQIVKSILGSCDIEFNNELQIILSDENKNILSPDELDVFKYLSKEFENILVLCNKLFSIVP